MNELYNMFIAANWKMNLTKVEAENLAVEFINLDTPKNEVVVKRL